MCIDLWFFFGVSSDMHCKIRMCSKFLLAILTLIRFGVSFNVPCKIMLLNKALLAIFTLIRFLFVVSFDVPC